MTYTGAFKNKIKLANIIKEYQFPLACIALIHRMGEIKYPSYSWFNDPEASDSTVENNINAMLRHFSAHRMGFAIDPESNMPHLCHLACRAGMLITTFYRGLNGVAHTDLMSKPSEYPNNPIGAYITGEEILSLSKVAKHEKGTALVPRLNSLLINTIFNEELIDIENEFTTCNVFDSIFQTTLDLVAFNHDFICDYLQEHRSEYSEPLNKILNVILTEGITQ